MDTSTIAPIKDIEVAHGFQADGVVSHSAVASQLPVPHVDRSVDVASTVQTVDDIASRSMTHLDRGRVATQSLDGVRTGDYIMMAAVFVMIVFLWVQ